MANLKAEFHGHLTLPGVKYDEFEEISICLLESDLKRSKSHASVVALMRMCLISQCQ